VDGNSVSGEGAFEERFGGFDKLMPFLILFFFSEFRSEFFLILVFAFYFFNLLHSSFLSVVQNQAKYITFLLLFLSI